MAMAVPKKTPRYVVLATRLEEEISQLGPNSLLPTEQQLARRFDVSRITVRGALDLLERSGLVSRLRGRGTVVSPPKITRRFSPLYSFEKDLASQGIKFTTQVLSFSTAAKPPPAIRERLNVARGGLVGFLSLVRLVEDRIVCHDCRYYPQAIAKRLNPQQFEDRDASEMLEAAVGAPIADVEWEAEIVSAPPEVAAPLKVANRTLVLASTYTWRIAGNVSVEAGVIYYRVDRCKFKYQTRFEHPR